MAQLIEVTGIVIAASPSGEYDKRVLILTRELGKISAFAKGARRPGNHLMAAADSFVFGTFTLYPGRSSYTIEKAEVKNYFKEFSTDLVGAYYGYYFLELADYFTRENVDETETISLLYYSLRALSNEQLPNKLVRCIYELKQLVIEGEYPNMFACGNCGSKEDIAGFSIMSNGVVCRECLNQKGVIPISAGAVRALQYVVTTEIGKLYSFTVSEQVLDELIRVMKLCTEAYIDKKMKSIDMLEMLDS